MRLLFLQKPRTPSRFKISPATALAFAVFCRHRQTGRRPSSPMHARPLLKPRRIVASDSKCVPSRPARRSGFRASPANAADGGAEVLLVLASRIQRYRVKDAL